LDFSEHADNALDNAMALAQASDAQLLLMHVRDEASLNPFYFSGQETIAARQTLNTYLQRVQEAGVEGEIVIKHGVPWLEIVELAKTEKVDLIVIGTRGRTGLPQILLGSVAQRVVQLAPCPVLVARRRGHEA
jgi:universal stress protein A